LCLESAKTPDELAPFANVRSFDDVAKEDQTFFSVWQLLRYLDRMRAPAAQPADEWGKANTETERTRRKIQDSARLGQATPRRVIRAGNQNAASYAGQSNYY